MVIPIGSSSPALEFIHVVTSPFKFSATPCIAPPSNWVLLATLETTLDELWSELLVLLDMTDELLRLEELMTEDVEDTELSALESIELLELLGSDDETLELVTLTEELVLTWVLSPPLPPLPPPQALNINKSTDVNPIFSKSTRIIGIP